MAPALSLALLGCPAYFLIEFSTALQLKDALDVLDVKMKNEHVRPDKYIYNLLISGCANVGYTKKAFQLFNQVCTMIFVHFEIIS